MNVSFNTVNSKYYSLITFVLPSLRSGTWYVRASSSRCFSAASHPSAHTVNDKHCCNSKMMMKSSLVKICFNTVNGKLHFLIIFVLPSLRSGTWDVRASSSRCSSAASPPSAHTVNGKGCCNKRASEGQYSWGLKIGFGKPHTLNGQFGLPLNQKCRWA